LTTSRNTSSEVSAFALTGRGTQPQQAGWRIPAGAGRYVQPRPLRFLAATSRIGCGEQAACATGYVLWGPVCHRLRSIPHEVTRVPALMR